MGYLAVLACTAAFMGVGIEFVSGPDRPSARRIFLYYTVQTNVISGIVMALAAVAYLGARPQGPVYGAVLDAAAVWILVTALVFHLMLSRLYTPEGPRRVSNFLMHTLTPVLVLIVSLAAPQPETPLQTAPLWWISYPVLYFAFAMIRGKITGFYPYWFLKPSDRYPDGNGSCGRVLLTALALLLGFVALGFVLRYARAGISLLTA